MNLLRSIFPMLAVLMTIWYWPLALAEPALEKGLCNEDRERWGALCYEKCKPGFHGFGPTCWQTCPGGFTDYGVGCSDLNIFAKESYGRGAGEPMSCKPGQWQNGLLCYEGCRGGYHGVGPVCWQHCPPGTHTDFGLFCVRYPTIKGWGGWWIFRWPIMDWGWVHWKHSYGRGWGDPLNHCRPGTFQNGALCYPGCRDGFSGAGPVCWQVCPHTHRDDGAFCRRDNGFTKQMYFRDAGVPLQFCPEYPRNTHYPIILVHGFAGVDSIRWFGGKDLLHYFHDVIPNMSRGKYGATVYLAQVGSFEATSTRGEQLMKIVDKVLKETGKKRVHLIGHSQGAPTSRYVASLVPEKVASVTSVSGVNFGTAMVRLAEDVSYWDAQGDPAERAWARDVINFFAPLMNLLAFNDVNKFPIDAGNSLISFSDGGLRVLNWMHPWGLPSYVKGQGKDWDSPLGFVSAIKKEALAEILTLNKTPSGRIILRERADRLEKIPREDAQFPILYYSWGGLQPFSGISIFGSSALFAMIDQFMVDHYRAERSDGAVEKSAQRLGRMLGYYEQDHFLSGNMYTAIVNLSALWGKAHPISLYCEHAHRLWKAEKELLGIGPDGKEGVFEKVPVDPHGKPLQPPRYKAEVLSLANSWQCLRGIAPAVRLNAQGDVEAVTRDGKHPIGCKQGLPAAHEIRPLACGEPHKRIWGWPGYGTAGHWCEQARAQLQQDLVFERSSGAARSLAQGWRCLPGVRFAVRLNADGDVEAITRDGKHPYGCGTYLDGGTPPPHEIRPLTCGKEHARIWGGPGYDLPGHWCQVARAQFRREITALAVTAQPAKSWQWQCLPGVTTPVRLNDAGDVEAMSNDGRHAMWQSSDEQCRGLAAHPPERIAPLGCGKAHAAIWGSTGYETAGHWCTTARDSLNDWQCRPFGSKYAPMRKNALGDVQALSRNGTSVEAFDKPELCLQAIHERPGNLQPVTCGEAHQNLFGVTGYESEDHWCARNRDLK